VEQSLRFDYFDLAEFTSTLQHLAFLKWHRGSVFEAEGLLQVNQALTAAAAPRIQ
jgi:hypothetical protein